MARVDVRAATAEPVAAGAAAARRIDGDLGEALGENTGPHTKRRKSSGDPSAPQPTHVRTEAWVRLSVES